MVKTLEELAAEVHAAKKAYWEAMPKITVAELEAYSAHTNAGWFEKRSLFMWVNNDLATVGWAEQKEGTLYSVWGHDTHDNEVLLGVTTGEEEIGMHEDVPPLSLADA